MGPVMYGMETVPLSKRQEADMEVAELKKKFGSDETGPNQE